MMHSIDASLVLLWDVTCSFHDQSFLLAAVMSGFEAKRENLLYHGSAMPDCPVNAPNMPCNWHC